MYHKKLGDWPVICAFSGHRPWRLPWGNRESSPQCLAVKMLMRQYLDRLTAEGYNHFLCGMALGADFYFAQTVLDCKQSAPSLTLEAVLPNPEQDARWADEFRARYQALLAQCDKITVLEPEYSQQSYLARNRYLVDHSDLLMTLYDGGEGGTAYTVWYAQQQGRKILPLWL